jgi:hypothetical protein
MNYEIICTICGNTFWTRGTEEQDTNALVLDDNDPWPDACEHLRNGEDNYRIGRSEYIDEAD